MSNYVGTHFANGQLVLTSHGQLVSIHVSGPLTNLARILQRA